jgi:hypothetical protein
MNREQLAHICRAAAKIADDPEILVIGSQAILGSFDDSLLPEAAIMSVEADIAFFDDPDDEKADKVDGAIGEASQFHQAFGVYGQGVSVQTAILPAGWRSRLVLFDRDDTHPGRPVCLDPYDLVASKLAAGREKDRAFAEALVMGGLLRADKILERTTGLETDVAAVRRRAESLARSLVQRFSPPV